MQNSLKHGGIMLVCDGEKALFLRNAGDEMYPNLQVWREMEQDNPPTREQGTDSPGRSFDSTSMGRSAYEETDWHRLAKEDFAKQMAARLYKWAHQNRFDELIIVAPPLVLCELRKEMHKEVAARVKGELARELTGHPVDRIEKLVLGG